MKVLPRARYMTPPNQISNTTLNFYGVQIATFLAFVIIGLVGLIIQQYENRAHAKVKETEAEAKKEVASGG